MAYTPNTGFPVMVGGVEVLISHKEQTDATRPKAAEVLIGMDGKQYISTGPGTAKLLSDEPADVVVNDAAAAEEGTEVADAPATEEDISA